MRTSHLTFIALLVTLWVATPSMADTEASASASANPTYDYDDELAKWNVSVWEAGDYTWSYSLYAWAGAYVRGSGSPSGSSADASASATVTTPAGTDNASASVPISGMFDGYTASDYVEGNGTETTTGAEDVLGFEEYSKAEAEAGNPTIDAYARAYTTASGSVDSVE